MIVGIGGASMFVWLFNIEELQRKQGPAFVEGPSDDILRLTFA